MAKKNAKNMKPVAETSKPAVTVQPVANGVVLTVDLPTLLASIRAADSFDNALAVLAPAAPPKTDATYTVNEKCTEPLPQKRGASVRVYVAAARLNGPFKVADIVAALPEVKGAKFWVGKLAKTGHFTVAE